MKRRAVFLSVAAGLLVAAVAAVLGYRAYHQHDVTAKVAQVAEIARIAKAPEDIPSAATANTSTTATTANPDRAASAGEAAAALARGMDMASQAFKALRQDASDVQAGKLTELQADDRSRTVHAPRFRLVMQDLARARFPAGDPRAAFAQDYTRLVELVLEGLSMESKVVNGKPLPVDPSRAAVIEAEIQTLNARIPKEMEELKTMQGTNERK